jgi:hypothetical protein
LARWRWANSGEPEMAYDGRTVARARRRHGDSTCVVGEGWDSPWVALRGSGAQAKESHRRQARDGVEAGVEVDAEVHGTWPELVVVLVGQRLTG